MRVLAIDLGARHVGLAKSDLMRTITQPHATLDRTLGDKKLVKQIAEICQEEEVSDIVIGLPKHMNGQEGEGAKDARNFAEKLKAVLSSIPIHFWDERLSTVAAIRHMSALDVKTNQRKKKVDQLAAEMILSGFLQQVSTREE